MTLAEGTHLLRGCDYPFGLNFTVASNGTFGYDPSLEGILSGAGTNVLVVNGVTVTVDAHEQDEPYFMLGRGLGLPFPAATPLTAALLPGNYGVLTLASANMVDFSVNGQGQITYAPSLEGVLSGAGTSTLLVHGAHIVVDARPLAEPTFRVDPSSVFYPTNKLDTLIRIPGDYVIRGGASGQAVSFTISNSGKIGYESNLVGILLGAGTSRLTVRGVRITIDALYPAVSQISVGSASVVECKASRPRLRVRLIPGNYFVRVNCGIGPHYDFSVDRFGRVHYSPLLEGPLHGQGTNVLFVDGPSWFRRRGFIHFPLGNGQLTWLPAGVQVTGVGPGFTDGLGFHMSGIPWSYRSNAGLGFRSTFTPVGSIDAPGQVRYQMFGTVGGNSNTSLGHVTYNLFPTAPHTVDVSIPGVGPNGYSATVFSGNSIVHHAVGVSGAGISVPACPAAVDSRRNGTSIVDAAGDPIPGVLIDIEQVPGGIAVTFEDSVCHAFNVGDGAGTFVGDRLVVTAEVSLLPNAGDKFDQVHVLTTLPVVVQEEGFQLWGTGHTPLGSAYLPETTSYQSVRSSIPSVAVLHGISGSGNDGVRILIPEGRNGLHAEFGNTALTPADSGATLTTRVNGIVAGNPGTLFTVSYSATPGGNLISSDFHGATAESVIVLDGGAVVYRGAEANGIVVSEEGFPLSAGAPGSSPGRDGRNGVLATGDPIPGVDVSLEQVPGGIAAGPGRTATLTYASSRTFRIGASAVNGDRLIMKRIFRPSSFVMSDLADDSTATITSVEFLASSPGESSLDSLVIENEIFTTSESLGSTDVPVITLPATSEFGVAPNPFRRALIVRYALPASGFVRLAVYDLAGRRVRVLHDGMVEAGPHQSTWDARDDSGVRAAAGMYFARLTFAGQTVERRVILIP